MSIQENLQQINENIAKVQSKPSNITIVAVTKNINAIKAEEVLASGVTNLGENRPQSFLEKYEHLGDKAIWHFIGTLQTRKVKDVINKIDFLHSLDRLSLAKEINKRAEKPVKCFLQIKTSDEEAKQGLSTEDAIAFVKEVEQYEKIEVVGLMTMAPFTEDTKVIRNCFTQLKQTQEAIQKLALDYAPCQELSMGMSNDYVIAIEEGATFIRLGTCLVGA